MIVRLVISDTIVPIMMSLYCEHIWADTMTKGILKPDTQWWHNIFVYITFEEVFYILFQISLMPVWMDSIDKITPLVWVVVWTI